MKLFNARQLLDYEFDFLWDTLYGEFALKFDNGEIVKTNAKHTLYSLYFWTFHKVYPCTPLLPNHHLEHLIQKTKYLNSKTHITLLKNIYWDVCDAYKAHTPNERDPMTKMIYEITNLIYNDLPPRIEEYMLTLDALDFVKLVTHPDMDKILNDVTEERSTIDRAYDRIFHLLHNDESLADNPIVKCVRYGSVDKNQVLQCIGPRGFVTEVDNQVLGKPITRSYTEGMRSLYNIAADSRSAAKSLYNSEKPLQDSEYFARRLQLVAMSVERLHYCDCGSKEFLHWVIKGPEYNYVRGYDKDGKETVLETISYKGDLPNLIGKYYLLEEEPDDAPLKVIKATDTHLIGKAIKMRSAIFCKHPDPAGVCEICFGEMAYNVNQDGNLGHNCSTSMTSVISQSVLSTKHLDASSKSELIQISPENRKYLVTDKNRVYYKLRKELSHYKPMIIAEANELYGLVNLNQIKSLKNVNITSFSNISNFTLRLTNKEGVSTDQVITVSQNRRNPSLSVEFLKYLKQFKWKSDDQLIYIDMHSWDYDDPILKLPEFSYSFAQYQNDIALLLESNIADAKNRAMNMTPVDLLSQLFDIINRKLTLNISLIEVVIYALMIYNYKNGNYGLARGSDDPRLGCHSLIVKNRSLSAAYAYEKQESMILDPLSFFGENERPDHVLDVFIDPAEVAKYEPKPYKR